MFWKKKPPAPKPDQLALFHAIIAEQIGNATANASWSEKVRVAEVLERFAECLRLEIAMKRPL